MAGKLSKKEILRELPGKIKRKIKERGLFRFILFALKKLSIFFSVSLIYMVIRLIRPIIFVRFGSLYAHRIGPLISLPGLYLCEKDHNIQPQNSLDIFHDGYGQVCNHHLLKMWKRVFVARRRVLLANGIVKDFFQLAKRFSFAGDHIISTTKDGCDVLGLIEKSDIYLKFTEKEVSQAKLGLEKMSIKEGSPYVCMLNRDQRYLNETFPETNWDYHSFRNCNIENYVSAVKELTKRGYYVIRMGTMVGNLMNINNPKFIEYAGRGFRTELLDIYLAANCYFFIGCGSGFDAVPWFFKRPEVYVNISDFEQTLSWLSNCVSIFKKFWLRKKRRFMTVEEIINSGAGRYLHTEKYENMGIELIENTPEEILDVVEEMDQRLKGTWQMTEEDEELQMRFWSYFNSSGSPGVIRSRIGAKFLRQNKELLGLSSRVKSII